MDGGVWERERKAINEFPPVPASKIKMKLKLFVFSAPNPVSASE